MHEHVKQNRGYKFKFYKEKDYKEETEWKGIQSRTT
jgi:hypothetical protein